MKKTLSDTGVLVAILEFNQDRKSGLLRLKLRKMRADPFTFFRGADHLFCRDWPELRPLDVGPDVLISGDLHLENFGAHRTMEGDFRYDLNDFDEAVVAPCSLDVVRCATSIILASEQWKLKPSQATGMALAYLENYREAVLKAVESRSVHEIVPHGGHGPIQEILGSTAIATQAQLLKATTRRKADGRPLIRRTDAAVDVSRKRFDEVAAALESHGQRPRASPTLSRFTTWSSGSSAWAVWECAATWHSSREPALPMATICWTSRNPGRPRRPRVPRTPWLTSRVTRPGESSCPRRFSRGTWPSAWMC